MLQYPSWLNTFLPKVSAASPSTSQRSTARNRTGTSKDRLVGQLLKLMPSARLSDDDRRVFEGSSQKTLRKLIGTLRGLDRMGISKPDPVKASAHPPSRKRLRKR